MKRLIIALAILYVSLPLMADPRFNFPWPWGEKAGTVAAELRSNVSDYLKAQLPSATDGQKESLNAIQTDLGTGFLWTLNDGSACIFFSKTDGSSWPYAFSTQDQQIISDILAAQDKIKDILYKKQYKDFKVTTGFFININNEVAFALDMVNQAGETKEIQYEGNL
ncbi:MAG: hypothetical protein PHW04_05895 [Candidatus Wallbacteria bacterium]|nr:hypothetical protein [Candidatus Wallbacteria bacterium]